MVRLSYDRLKNDLLSLSKNDYMRRKENREVLLKDEVFTLQISILSSVWLLIDLLNRFKELLLKTPGLKQKSPELIVFYQKIEIVEYFRNNIQHLNESIIQYVVKNIPAWNTLNWVARLDNSDTLFLFSLVPGTLFSRETPWINPLGKTVHTPIGLITLCSDKEVCLSELIENDFRKIVFWLQDVLKIDFIKNAQSVFTSIELSPNK
jgi:hypothetical protein